MMFDYSKDPLLNVSATRGNIAQLLPIIKPTASDYVVDCRKCPLGMVQMTVQHA